MALSIYRFYQWLQPGLRQKRLRLLLDCCRPGPSTRILDIGGYVANWEGVAEVASSITLLNLSHPPAQPGQSKRFTCAVGDGCRMQYPDQAFDLAYSNSVIEHLGTFENQKRFAAEVRRVGKQLFVQTPNRWFFIEPHFVAPFLHFLPWPIAKRLLRWFSFRALVRQGDNINLRELADELRLLTEREVRSLFPDCEIHREKWFGMTKSFIAIRR